MGTATAEARLVLNAQGVEDGAKRAEAAFQRITAGEGQMRRTIEKPAQHGMERTFDSLLEREGKVKNQLRGMVEDFAHARSGADLLAGGMSRLSEVFKIGVGPTVGVAAIAAIILGSAEAGKKIQELDDQLEDLEKPRGGVGNQRLTDLQDQLTRTQDFISKGQTNLSGSDMGDFLRVGAERTSDVAGGLFNNMVSPLTGESPKTFDEIVHAREQRMEEARALEEKIKGQIADKVEIGGSIGEMQRSGSEFKASKAAIDAKYAEAEAPYKKTNPRGPNPANARLVAAMEFQHQGEISDTTFAFQKKVEERSLQKNLLDLQERNASPVEAARENLRSAKAQSTFAGSRSEEERADADLRVKQSEIILRNAEREQEINRRTSEITTEAMRDRVEGEQRRGDLIERNAVMEAAATRARIAGNPEEEAQIRARESLKQFDENVSASYDHSTGHARTADLLRDIHKQDIAEKQKADAEKRLRDNGGLLEPQRNTHGEVIGGIDPKTGKFIGSHDNDAPPISVNKNGERTFGANGPLAPIGNFGSKNGPETTAGTPEYDPLGLLNKSGGKSTAAKEMADLQSKGAVNVGSPESGGGKGGSTGGNSGSDSTATMAADIALIRTTLDSWNK